MTCSAAALASDVMLEMCKISLGIQAKCLTAVGSPFSLMMNTFRWWHSRKKKGRTSPDKLGYIVCRVHS